MILASFLGGSGLQARSKRVLLYHFSSMSESRPLSTSLSDRIVGFSEWWTLHKQSSLDPTSNGTPLRLLDLRQSKEYESCRLSGRPDDPTSSLLVVPFPIEHMEERSFELPARHVEFTILLSECDLVRASSYLLGEKYKARKRLFHPWKITHVLLDNVEFWEEVKARGVAVHGRDSVEPISINQELPKPRLWQPDSMVENVLFPLLRDGNLSHPTRHNDHSDKDEISFEIWDLASGAGRDAVFLAEELQACKKEYKVLAVDHRYNNRETAIVNDFFQRRGVGNKTECLNLNLSEWQPLEDVAIERGRTSRIAALYCVRFWKPDLVEAVARSPYLPAGVLFGISHFCKPHQGAAWLFDHPSEKTVLERNQLAHLFEEAGWKILHNEIASDCDHGRTMVHFVARRP
jgi:hypothetical protein